MERADLPVFRLMLSIAGLGSSDELYALTLSLPLLMFKSKSFWIQYHWSKYIAYKIWAD